jgi:glycosyltransferase involved in cell wall biosynthesis
LNFPEIQSARPDRQRFGLPEKLLLFGFFFDPNSVLERKNIKGLIKAFLSAFGPTDRVALILKSVSTLEHNLEYEQIKATAAASNNRIILMELALDRSNTFAFMASLDVYVSLHRSEGFGLTCAEAMALGIPVVATDYSGNLDFMSNDNSLLIPAKVIETEREYGPYPAGSRWADPDIDAASEAMRSLLSESYREALGKKGQQAICDKLSIKSCQSHMERALLGT